MKHDERLTITIIGLGLIGGSLAKAMHEKLGVRDITAIDSDLPALELAQKEGIISKGILVPDSGISAIPSTEMSSVFTSEIFFICTPVKQALNYIHGLAPYLSDTTIITDVCSTKEEITSYVEAIGEPLCFIGGHPMAGTERSGYSSSFSHLFENAYYVLTPGSAASQKSLNKLTDIVKGIGAIPIIMSPSEHDRAAGGISHLPHVVAAALVNLVKELDRGSGKMQTLAAGGFRDITRIASSSPVMWENIVFSNKSQISELIALFKKALDEFAVNLENGNSNAVYNFFADAGLFRDSISTQSTGMIQPVYRLVVDVEDKPGIIGQITTILGRNSINIKNINVSNSREFEQGCLTISLPDTSSVNDAFKLLISTGYKVYKIK